MIKRIATLCLVLTVGAGSLELILPVAVQGFHGLISAAEARVGRPLTPVSVAGVARRTARRCAVGAYC
jgi:hypothetical protein